MRKEEQEELTKQLVFAEKIDQLKQEMKALVQSNDYDPEQDHATADGIIAIYFDC